MDPGRNGGAVDASFGTREAHPIDAILGDNGSGATQRYVSIGARWAGPLVRRPLNEEHKREMVSELLKPKGIASRCASRSDWE